MVTEAMESVWDAGLTHGLKGQEKGRRRPSGFSASVDIGKDTGSD